MYITLQDRNIARLKQEAREEKVMKWALIIMAGYFIIRIVVSLIWKI